MAIIEIFELPADNPRLFEVGPGDFDMELDVVLAEIFGHEVALTRTTRSQGTTTDGARFWEGRIGNHDFVAVQRR